MSALMMGKGRLHGVPDETANRLMMVHGSGLLLSALRNPPPPPAPIVQLVPPPPPRVDVAAKAIQRSRRKWRARYVPVAERVAPKPPESIRNLMVKVAEVFEVLPEDLASASRAKFLVEARVMAIRLIRDRRLPSGEPKHSTTTIGLWFNRDHSTICYALGKFADYCRQPKFRETYISLGGRP